MATYLTRLARLTRTPTHSTTITRRASSFRTGPAPPRLPPSEQAEFERLQRTANTQEGFNATSSPDFTSQTATTTTTMTKTTQQTTLSATAAAEAIGTDNAAAAAPPPLPLRKGAPPEFEGDVNPRTGEVGGPKNEPLRWGAAGDYSYNGRVTDF